MTNVIVTHQYFPTHKTLCPRANCFTELLEFYPACKDGIYCYRIKFFDRQGRVHYNTDTVGAYQTDYIVYNGKLYYRKDFGTLALAIGNKNTETLLNSLP